MKNPNGYGSVIKLSGNRRRPFAVRITTGWTDTGRQKYSYLGYYESRREAMMALADYNKNPYDLDARKTKFSDVFELWSKEKYPKISKSNSNGYNAAFQDAAELHDLVFVDLRKNHMQAVIDECEKSHASLRKIKSLFNQLYKYALQNDLASKDYASFVELPPDDTVSDRKPFSAEEIQLLWENVNRMDFVDVVLIMIYTGLRPGEIITIENNDVYLDKRYLRGGIKTAAGKNRLIPIHKKIHHLIEARYNPENKYLITNEDGKGITYFNLRAEKFGRIMEQLELEHKPHDCRHTFATLLDNAGANKLSIKRIMGHASQDVTDKVYTHKDIEQLLKAIDLLE